MSKPFDVLPVLPGSIAGDDAVQDMTAAIASVEMDPGLPALLWTYIEDEPSPPDAILDAIAADLHIDDWDEGWDASTKQQALRDAITWHRAKGTPEGVRWTLERAGVPHATVFERWDLLAWLLTKTDKRFDTGLADVEALDQFEREGPFDFDENLGPFAFWVAVRPGWGGIEGDDARPDPMPVVRRSQRVAAERISVFVPKAEPVAWDGRSETDYGLITNSSDLVATLRPDGKYGSAIAVEEGTTNNFSVPRDFTSWQTALGASVTGDSGDGPYGDGKADTLHYDGTGNGQVRQVRSDLQTSTEYTFSVWLRLLSGSPNPSDIQVVASGAGVGTGASMEIGDQISSEWQRFDVQFTTTSSQDNVNCNIRCDIVANVEAWGAQQEAKAIATSFVDGTRADGKLRYDVDVDPEAWAVSASVYIDWARIDDLGTIVSLYKDSGNYVDLRRASDREKVEIVFNKSSVIVSSEADLSEGWHHLTLRQSGDTVSIEEGATTLTNLTTTERIESDWILHVGNHGISGRNANALFSEPLFWRKAPTPSELADQAARVHGFTPLKAGRWPARPIDRL